MTILLVFLNIELIHAYHEIHIYQATMIFWGHEIEFIADMEEEALQNKERRQKRCMMEGGGIIAPVSRRKKWTNKASAADDRMVNGLVITSCHISFLQEAMLDKCSKCATMRCLLPPWQSINITLWGGDGLLCFKGKKGIGLECFCL